MADPSIPAAFGAGVLSFISPCVLPLVPGYLSMIRGMYGEDIAKARGVKPRRVMRARRLFVAGFTVVIVAVADSTGAGGQLQCTPRRG